MRAGSGGTTTGRLRREVLDPLGAGGAMRLLPVLWDAERDRSARAARVPAAPGTVVVVDGPYLLRWELADAFDLVVHLDVSPAALARRCPADDLVRVAGSWARYLDETDPAERASYVVRLEDPRHPALVRRDRQNSPPCPEPTRGTSLADGGRTRSRRTVCCPAVSGVTTSRRSPPSTCWTRPIASRPTVPATGV